MSPLERQVVLLLLGSTQLVLSLPLGERLDDGQIGFLRESLGFAFGVFGAVDDGAGVVDAEGLEVESSPVLLDELGVRRRFLVVVHRENRDVN